MIEIIIMFTLCIICIVLLVFALRKVVSKAVEFEVAANKLNEGLAKSNASYEVWFDEFKRRIIESYQRMKAIDASGHFVADDEVGYFFTELKSIIERLYELGIMDTTEYEETNNPQQTFNKEELGEILKSRGAAITTIKKEERE